MLSGGLSKIRESINHIKPSEKNAAQYILENPEDVIRLSVQELAKRSESSPSAIIRLCKNLGMEGFQELKFRIAGDIQGTSNGTISEFKEIRPNDNIPTLIESISNNSVYSLKETLKIINPSVIEEAVEHLYKAKRIDFYGVGASQLVALDAQHKFMRINKHCTAYTDSHLQITSAATLSKGDIAVGISYSGETKQIITALELAKDRGATTIAMTKCGTNSLSKVADFQIEAISSESDMRSAATSSRIVQLNLIDILFIGVAGKDYKKSISHLRKSRNVIQEVYRNK